MNKSAADIFKEEILAELLKDNSNTVEQRKRKGTEMQHGMLAVGCPVKRPTLGPSLHCPEDVAPTVEVSKRRWDSKTLIVKKEAEPKRTAQGVTKEQVHIFTEPVVVSSTSFTIPTTVKPSSFSQTEVVPSTADDTPTTTQPRNRRSMESGKILKNTKATQQQEELSSLRKTILEEQRLMDVEKEEVEKKKAELERNTAAVDQELSALKQEEIEKKRLSGD